jgi:hypothetical protein
MPLLCRCHDAAAHVSWQCRAGALTLVLEHPVATELVRIRGYAGTLPCLALLGILTLLRVCSDVSRRCCACTLTVLRT